MDPFAIGIMAIPVFILLMALGLPIAFAFFIAGAGGIILIRGLGPGLYVLGSAPYYWSTMPMLIPMPLFILMGHFAFHSGISSDLYATAHKWLGRLPGGIAQATTLACTGFAACTGDSMAGAATMGTIAFPEMEKLKYNRRLSTACIAAGGTLGTMIPPSIGFILYGFLTQTSIAKLFLAGLFPGLMLSGLFLIMIFMMCKRNPKLGPPSRSYPWRERFASLRGVWGMLLLLILIVGGLYMGIFTPSEAGAIGAFGAFIIALVKRRITKSILAAVLGDSLRLTCFFFIVLVGAMTFNQLLALSGFMTRFSDMMAALPVSPYLVLAIVLFMYIPLGMVMDVGAMIILTVPIVVPFLVNLGFNPIWFGVLVGIMAEFGLISPPVGLNVYIVHGVTKVPLEEIFLGTWPFLVAMLVCVAILVAFPQICLFLPSTM